MQAVCPHTRDKGGKIINFGSGNGIASMRGTAAYNATKEAIRSLSRTAAIHVDGGQILRPQADSEGLLR